MLLVVLTPGISACRHRNTGRRHEEQFFFDDYKTLATGMRNAFGAVGWWFDTSALTPDETATRIIANGPALAPVGQPGG